MRYAGDIYTELILRFAKSINNHATTLFKAKLSPYATGAGKKANGNNQSSEEEKEELDTEPKKLEWNLTPELRNGIRFAETRLSDLICQNDIVALEFDVGHFCFLVFSIRHAQAVHSSTVTDISLTVDIDIWEIFHYETWILSGRFCTNGFPSGILLAIWSYGMHIRACYDQGFPAWSYRVYQVHLDMLHYGMEKYILLISPSHLFLTRTVQPESVAFVRAFCSDETTPREKMDALKAACKRHVDLTRECSKGLGQDRLLYALAALAKDPSLGALDPNDMTPINGNEKVTNDSNSSSDDESSLAAMPAIFKDSGYSTINHSVLSTSNCGNPCLRMFGFGAVVPDGFGIGYIIKVGYSDLCLDFIHTQKNS